MAERQMLDTNVVIDYLRRRRDAIAFIEDLEESPVLPAVVVAELYAGVRDGIERRMLDGLVQSSEVVPVNRAIAVRGGLYRRDYLPSHGVGLADALIAATAEAENTPLVTLNHKHFPMLKDVRVPYEMS